MDELGHRRSANGSIASSIASITSNKNNIASPINSNTDSPIISPVNSPVNALGRTNSLKEAIPDTDNTYRYSNGSETPPPLSSPSVASSLVLSTGALSPLRRELSRTTLHENDNEGDNPSSPAGRQELARRLSLLAQRLTYGDNIDEFALNTQVDQLEKALGNGGGGIVGIGMGVGNIDASSGILVKQHQPQPQHQRPQSIDMRSQARSDVGSLFGSPVSSLFRSRFSDLSASLSREREAEEEEEEEEPKKGMSPAMANKVLNETARLNDELETLVNNLRARQEESDHIHSLLIERAERAAQRIMFLQSRISYLEQELHENDDELQHLRISLKAVEIQMPPHPDRELQRCIVDFKEDYQALRRKRAHRSSLASVLSYDSTQTVASPLR